MSYLAWLRGCFSDEKPSERSTMSSRFTSKWRRKPMLNVECPTRPPGEPRSKPSAGLSRPRKWSVTCGP